MVKLSAIQLSSAANVETNLAKIAELLSKITAVQDDTQHLVVLPECCLYFGSKDSEQLDLAKTTAAGNDLRLALGELAKKFGVYLVAGTIPLLASSATKFTNSSCVFNPDGEWLSVCFDLRFPNLFQQLSIAGADIITVPSAFTKVTGKAHWQTLLQARAIENQVYIVAAGQEGVHENGRETNDH